MNDKVDEKDLQEKRVSGEIAFSGRLLEVSSDRVTLASGKSTVREVVHHPGGVVIIPVREADEGYGVVLVKQYRYPAGKALWELPAGTLEEGETSKDCARRELIEETLYRPTSLKRVTDLYTSPGYSDESLTLYLARGLKRVDEKKVDRPEEENLVARSFDLNEVLEKARNGEIRDGKTLAGLFFLTGYE
ncbi:NUDIX hydrolase [Candidatus Bipolaricaulota bacterium]|nr:NUDIX hydrolase [Candidatus Bipolaricaulota bacterium]